MRPNRDLIEDVNYKPDSEVSSPEEVKDDISLQNAQISRMPSVIDFRRMNHHASMSIVVGHSSRPPCWNLTKKIHSVKGDEEALAEKVRETMETEEQEEGVDSSLERGQKNVKN